MVVASPCVNLSGTRIECRNSEQFAGWMSRLEGSLAVTTYQAGRMALLGWRAGQLSLLMRQFYKAMGLAVAPGKLALATQHEITLLANNIFALIALRSEWTSESSYENRLAHLLSTLAGIANGNYKLTSATVKEGNLKDALKGGGVKDWYLRNSLGATVANRDTVTDADLDSVFTEISSWL